MTKLRLGVIGAGSMAAVSHLPTIERRRSEVEFLIVNRRDPRRLAVAKDRFGFRKASTDWHDVIAERPDLVIVSSPAAFHFEQARAALEAGAHVLCEKPFTVSPRDAWDLVRLAEKVERSLVVAFGWNYRPLIRRAKGLFESDGIGDIELLTIQMVSPIRPLLLGSGPYPGASSELVPRSETWIDPSISGGGYGQAQLSHALGVALWMTGLRGTQAFAFMQAPLGAAIELHAALTVRYDGGAVGTVSGGASHAEGDGLQLAIRAIGSRGEILIDPRGGIARRFRGPDDDVRLAVGPGDGEYDCLGPVDALVDLALGRNVENCSRGELGARTVEILDAAYRSSQVGAPVSIDQP